MAWFRLSRPGVDNGPCVGPCAHTDCAESRRTASAVCPYCGKACGYVQVPELLRGCLDVDTLRVHGGITYGHDSDGWIGFDTSHAGDVWDDASWMPPETREAIEIGRRYRPFGGEIHWTLNRLVAETEHLADQILALARTP